jgi:subtilisin family serine protease
MSDNSRARVEGWIVAKANWKIALVGVVTVLGARAEAAPSSKTDSSWARSRKLLQHPNSIPNEYIVVLQDTLTASAVSAFSDDLTYVYSAQVFATYEHALKGFAVRMTEDQARAVSADPAVSYVEENQVVTVVDTQTNPPWGLDRIDQRDLPLNNTYIYNATGAGINAYVIDTGIRVTHSEFGGRATGDFTAINDGRGADDCNGHGTHVSGTVGGITYGVAKNVRLHAVRVLDCGGRGTTNGVISGIDWVTANAVRPAVANMSLGGGVAQSLDDAVTRSVASGIPYGVAAGNSNGDACLESPARTPSAVTVASSTMTDARSSFSNYGTCVTLFAPGSGVLSSWATSDTATATLDGTSMATPHVVGTMALFLERNPGSAPAAVKQALIDNSTLNHITNPGPGTPNRLLYMAFIGGGGATPTTSITAPLSGDIVSGTVTISATASDITGIQRVEFYVDSALVGTSTSAPYSTTWDTTTVPNGTHAITSRAYNPGGGVGTSTPVNVTVSNGVLVNGDFETGTLAGWTPAGIASITTTAHGGLYAAQLGSTTPSTDSSIAQTFNLPADATTLTLWYLVHCPDTITYDWATATLYDNVTGTTLTVLPPTCTDTGLWVQVTANVAAMAGHSVTLTLSSHDDNYPGDATYTLYDDVTLQ